MTRSLISASATFPSQRYIRDPAEASPWPQLITGRHLRLAQPRPRPRPPGKANSALSPSGEMASANPNSQSRAHVRLLRHRAHWGTPRRQRLLRVEDKPGSRHLAWRGRGGCRHLPGHQSVMLSPPRNLDLGAAGRGSDRRCRRRAPGSLRRILRLPFEPPPVSEHERRERHDDDQITTPAASLVTLIGRDPPIGVAWSRRRPALGWRAREIVRCRPYQGTGVPSQEKNSPDGPSSGSSASRTTPAAASAGSPSLAAAAVLRSVRRRPGASALTLMPSSARA